MTSRLLDRERLYQALALAESVFGLTEPNPRVGCVIGDEQGTVFGRGATAAPGGPHAEVAALQQARLAGCDVRGATAWVTLEPCSHHGRTGPCCDALISAGLKRVVVGVQDPFPAVNGQGVARMRAAGVQVDFADAELSAACRAMNVGFFSRCERGRPWVRLKVAASLDGRVALEDGRSQWITSVAARQDTHAWRRRAGAVLTGIGTVLADDPRMDVRLVPTPRQPLRVVLDPSWRIPAAARLLQAQGEVAVIGAQPAPDRAQALRSSGLTLCSLPAADGKVDLDAALAWLADRGVNELHVEAGPRLNGAFFNRGLVDEVLAYLAPRLIGPGRPIAALDALPDLDHVLTFEWLEATPVGSDLRTRLLTRLTPRTRT